jgi:hypothetical protein
MGQRDKWTGGGDNPRGRGHDLCQGLAGGSDWVASASLERVILFVVTQIV